MGSKLLPLTSENLECSIENLGFRRGSEVLLETKESFDAQTAFAARLNMCRIFIVDNINSKINTPFPFYTDFLSPVLESKKILHNLLDLPLERRTRFKKTDQSIIFEEGSLISAIFKPEDTIIFEEGDIPNEEILYLRYQLVVDNSVIFNF